MNIFIKNIISFIVVLFSITTHAQNKSGNKVVFGGGGMVAEFNGDTSMPITKQYFPNTLHRWFDVSNSCISDSSTGKLLMLCNGMVLFDTLGNIIENGDSLVPSKMYNHNSEPDGWANQGSIILPKGSNGQYYIFTPSVSDSMYDYWKNLNQTKFPFDLLQYHIVDMNANNGMGKVIQKNTSLIEKKEISKVGMTAIRHANGYDWWLIKQGEDVNIIYTFLVTKDTVLLDTIQQFSSPIFGYDDLYGQSSFSNDGKIYAFASGIKNGSQLFIADFDRCYGIINNINVLQVPYDSTRTPLDGIWNAMDSLITGISFSENNRFLYVSRRYNIYQYDLWETNPANAWYHVQYGIDTPNFTSFEPYGSMYRGIDGRIYLGKWGGSSTTKNSVINKPNIKGVGCEFCKKCLQFIQIYYSSSSPANMPDFNLGALPYSCPPLNTGHLAVSIEQLEVYPNPSSSIFYIKNKKGKKKELYNAIGELILSTTKEEINVSRLSNGFYYIKCEGISKKVIVE